MPTLIDPDQSGFTKGRQSSDATRRLLNIIHIDRKNQTPSLLLALDAEKAFNRVHWLYLTHILDKFGFTGHLLSAILALYTSPSARMYTSGMLSKPFGITNGTRQGCPLSRLILNLLMELLAASIRQSPEIQGFMINNKKHVISLFVDE